MVKLDLSVPLAARCRMAMRRFPFAVASGMVAACTQLDVEADEALGGGVADDDRIVPSPLGCQRRHQALPGAFGSAWGSDPEVPG